MIYENNNRSDKAHHKPAFVSGNAVDQVVFAAGEEYTPIVLDEEAQVELNGVDKTEAVFSFVPAETCLYSFYSSCYDDTYGYILSAEGEVIAENDDSNYAGDSNFSATAMLTVGTTYLLKARFYDVSSEVALLLRLKKLYLPPL